MDSRHRRGESFACGTLGVWGGCDELLCSASGGYPVLGVNEGMGPSGTGQRRVHGDARNVEEASSCPKESTPLVNYLRRCLFFHDVFSPPREANGEYDGVKETASHGARCFTPPAASFFFFSIFGITAGRRVALHADPTPIDRGSYHRQVKLPDCIRCMIVGALARLIACSLQV